MSLDNLRNNSKAICIARVLALVGFFTLFGYVIYSFADPTDAVFLTSLTSMLVFLVVFFIGLKLAYQDEASFSFLFFIFGVPIGIVHTQVYLVNFLSEGLVDGHNWQSKMNDGLVLFSIGCMASGIGFFLGGAQKPPLKSISLSAALLCSLLFVSTLAMPMLSPIGIKGFVDIFSLTILGVIVIAAISLAFLKDGDFYSNLLGSSVFAFFVCSGIATISWYEAYAYASNNQANKLGPSLAVAILILLYAAIFHIFYLIFLLRTNGFRKLSDLLGVMNWHITEAYLFWFLICYGPATIIDITGLF